MYECMKCARLRDTLRLANVSDQRYISGPEVVGGHRYSQPGHWLLKAVGYISGNGCMKLAVHYVVFYVGYDCCVVDHDFV